MENLSADERKLVLPMNDDVDHKWLLLDKDVASVLMSMDSEYWKGFLRRNGKILLKLDKIMYGFKEAAYWWNVMLVKVFLLTTGIDN